MIYTAIFFIVFGILGLIATYSLGKANKDSIRKVMVGSILFTIIAFGWSIVLVTPKEKSHLEYLRGNLEVKYEYTYRDSILIKTDTIIEFKNQ